MSISNVDQQLVDEIKSLMAGVLGNSTLVKSEIMGDLPTDLVNDFVATYCTDESNRGLEIPIYFAFPTTPPKTAFLLAQYKGSVEDEDSSSLGGVQGSVQDKHEGPVLHEKVAFTYYPDKHALIGTTQNSMYSINSIPQLATKNINFKDNNIVILDINNDIGSMFDGIKTTDVYYSEYLGDKKSDLLPIGINTNEGVTIDFIASNTNTIRCLSALFLYIQIYLRHTIAENYNVYDPKLEVSGMDAIENLQNQGDLSQQLYYRRLTITYKVTQVISQSMAEKIKILRTQSKEDEDMYDELSVKLKKLTEIVDSIQSQIRTGNVADWKATDDKATSAKNLSIENKARIDQLTITPSGDGSTEIADVRVAPAGDLFNAKVSKTAGESVRYQTEALEAELNSALNGHGLQNLLPLEKSDWANLQLYDDGTWVNGNYWLTSTFVPIKPLHYYTVSTASDYRFMLNVYDKNKRFLYSTQNYTSNPYTFIADKNASYAIVSVNNHGTKMTQDDLPALKARLYEGDKFANGEFTYGSISDTGESYQSSVRVTSDYIKLDYNSDYLVTSSCNIMVCCYDRNKNYLPSNTVWYFTGSKGFYTGYGIRYIRFIVKKTDADGTDIPMFDFSDVEPKITKLANDYIVQQPVSPVWHIGAFDSDGNEKLDQSRMRSDPIRVNSNTAYDISEPSKGYVVGVMLYDLDMNYITSYDYVSHKTTVEGFDGFIRLYLKKNPIDVFINDSEGSKANITVTELNSKYLNLGKAGISLRIATNNVGSFGMGVQSGFSSNQRKDLTLDQLSQNWLKYTSGIDILAMQEFSTYLDQDKTVSMRDRLMNNFSVLKTGINNEALALKNGRLIDYKVGNLNGTQGWNTSGVRGYIKGTMQLNNGQNLSLYVVHFTPNSSDTVSRENQKNNLLKMLEDDPSFIVFGDFNTPADDQMWQEFNNKYHVINRGQFGTYIYGDTTIDNIIVSKNIVVKSAQVNPITDDNWVSTDHRMLIADVVVGESY